MRIPLFDDVSMTLSSATSGRSILIHNYYGLFGDSMHRGSGIHTQSDISYHWDQQLQLHLCELNSLSSYNSPTTSLKALTNPAAILILLCYSSKLISFNKTNSMKFNDPQIQGPES